MILIANGWGVAYTYDNLDRVTEVKASKDGTSYTIGRYIYDKLGRVARFVDGQVSGKSCTYGYDLTDRLCEAVFDDGTAYRLPMMPMATCSVTGNIPIAGQREACLKK